MMAMARLVLSFSVLVFALAATHDAAAQPASAAENPDNARLAWLREHQQAPIDFVVSRFATRDVVILGEHHEVRENCEFVSSLVPALASAGVHTIGTEFFRSSQQADIDRLVRGDGDAFDEQLGIRLMRELPWPTWGYREYLDIAEAVWKHNHGLRGRTEAGRFRLVGIDNDWSQVEMWSRASDAAARMQATLGRENHMVATVKREVLEKDEKALLHVGFAHSVLNQGLRLGTQLRRDHGDRIGQVALHHSCEATAALERLLGALGGKPCGFPVVAEGSPLADIEAAKIRMGPRTTVFGLGEIAEAWVFLKPADELQKVRWIEGFIDATHFEDARMIAIRRGWIESESDAKDPDELNRKIAAALR